MLIKLTIEKLVNNQMEYIFGGIYGGCSKRKTNPLREKSCVSNDKTNVEVGTVVKCTPGVVM